jgi:hypothetical protein
VESSGERTRRNRTRAKRNAKRPAAMRSRRDRGGALALTTGGEGTVFAGGGGAAEGEAITGTEAAVDVGWMI